MRAALLALAGVALIDAGLYLSPLPWLGLIFSGGLVLWISLHMQVGQPGGDA